MSNLTVYKKMTLGPAELFAVMKQEIGVKSACVPFAVKAIEALNSLPSMTESEALRAANTFLSDLQTLHQGGITPEDYDKTDFIKRGKVITISARVEAFLRAAARKGYRITETVIAVPAEDAGTTYFKENFHDGDIIYTLEDKRLNPDRAITARRLIDGYFSKFICRLDVADIKQAKRIVMTTCEMSNEDVLSVSAASEQGIFKTRWEKYTKENGYQGNRKVITDELNDPSVFWVKWTGEMVTKTVIRRALKRIREVLPELKDAIYAFDRDEDERPAAPQQDPVEIPMESHDVDLQNLTQQQQEEARDVFELFKANPKLAADRAGEIKALLDGGAQLQTVINTHYASIVNIKRSKSLYPMIRQYFEVAQ